MLACLERKYLGFRDVFSCFLCTLFLMLGRRKCACMEIQKERNGTGNKWEDVSGAFFRDGLLVRGTGSSLTGFRLACIKNVFRNIKYLGFLNYCLIRKCLWLYHEGWSHYIWQIVPQSDLLFAYFLNCARMDFPNSLSHKLHPHVWSGEGKRLEGKRLAWEMGTQYVNEPPWRIHFIMLRESN